MKEYIIRAILYQDMSVKWKDAELNGDVNMHLNVHQKTRQIVEAELDDFLLSDGEVILASFEKAIDGEIYHENPAKMDNVEGDRRVFRLQIPTLVHNTPGEWIVQFFVATDYDLITGNYTDAYPFDKARFSEHSSIIDDGLTVPTGENLRVLYAHVRDEVEKAERAAENAEKAAEKYNDLVSEKGQANGIATLNESGKVPSSQLPSYVDDIIEADSYANLPKTGETGKIYVVCTGTNANCTYRWSGTKYVKISESLNLENGEGTSSVQQVADSVADGFDFTDKNPNATALDSTLKGTIAYGATGDFASSFGGKSAAIGKRSSAKGTTTIAKGNYSSAEGDNSVALGDDSHAEGYKTTAYGKGSHAEGQNTIAKEDYSHAEGNGSSAVGIIAHAEGENTQAKGYASHTEGYKTIAEALYAHAEGENTSALARGSHTDGLGTKALYEYQHISGKYNDNKADTIYEVGNGTSEEDRSNAFEVCKDGRAKTYGEPKEDEDIVRLRELKKYVKKDLLYPIGSIYLSAQETSPASLFGGEWEQIKDTFLLSAGDTYTAGSTGGTATHSHTLTNAGACVTNDGAENAIYFSTIDLGFDSNNAATFNGQMAKQTGSWHTGTSAKLVGSTDRGDNIPPYLAVYMWKRVA